MGRRMRAFLEGAERALLFGEPTRRTEADLLARAVRDVAEVTERRVRGQKAPPNPVAPRIRGKEMPVIDVGELKTWLDSMEDDIDTAPGFRDLEKDGYRGAIEDVRLWLENNS